MNSKVNFSTLDDDVNFLVFNETKFQTQDNDLFHFLNQEKKDESLQTGESKSISISVNEKTEEEKKNELKLKINDYLITSKKEVGFTKFKKGSYNVSFNYQTNSEMIEFTYDPIKLNFDVVLQYDNKTWSALDLFSNSISFKSFSLKSKHISRKDLLKSLKSFNYKIEEKSAHDIHDFILNENANVNEKLFEHIKMSEEYLSFYNYSATLILLTIQIDSEQMKYFIFQSIDTNLKFNKTISSENIYTFTLTHLFSENENSVKLLETIPCHSLNDFPNLHDFQVEPAFGKIDLIPSKYALPISHLKYLRIKQITIGPQSNNYFLINNLIPLKNETYVNIEANDSLFIVSKQKQKTKISSTDCKHIIYVEAFFTSDICSTFELERLDKFHQKFCDYIKIQKNKNLIQYNCESYTDDFNKLFIDSSNNHFEITKDLIGCSLQSAPIYSKIKRKMVYSTIDDKPSLNLDSRPVGYIGVTLEEDLKKDLKQRDLIIERMANKPHSRTVGITNTLKDIVTGIPKYELNENMICFNDADARQQEIFDIRGEYPK